jgi:hypothetical protein
MLLQEWRKTGEKSILMTFVKRKNVTHQNKDFRQRRRRIKYNKWSLNYHFLRSMKQNAQPQVGQKITVASRGVAVTVYLF